MKIRTFIGAAAAAVAVAGVGTGVASADPFVAANGPTVQNPADYLVGDTVYFSAGYANCSMRPNGDVGCDISPGIANLWGIPITNLAIDLPFLPAHPTFGLTGALGRPGSRSIGSGPAADGYDYGGTISYGGATCSGGGRGAVSCTSKGHSFNFGWSGTNLT
ncbi:hypothetical protein [Nocardia spumae]|uniref:hypothetical protein n=1 Tax=Nocardia spumae TaxID=2887190 RepID=UPI001D145663|nr:hypothetical protein [Nocardia spumae]